jgi:diguanylate cyclase (GGDEF)-like protein/PAS domain S-box-containing protein/hemerythrin-like metal-binding protein
MSAQTEIMQEVCIMDNNSIAAQPEILLVEDSPVEAKIMRRILVRAGYRVRLASNGAQGLEALHERPADLVMSDVLMPLMNGYQLCREIKSDARLSHIPVMLLTVLSEPEDIIEALQVGADSYISKPFVKDITLENIRTLLAGKAEKADAEEREAGRVEYNGKSYLIPYDNQQMLNLLLSVYRNTVAQNRELLHTRNQLGQLNDSLDQKVQERTAELRESEMRTRTILNTALDAFICMDSAGFVTGWNAEAEKLFGYAHTEALGKNLSDLIIPPAYRDAHQRGLSHFIKTGEGQRVGSRVEITALRKDGSEFAAELSVTAINKGKEVFFSAFMRDITERKQVESKITYLAFHDKLTALPNRELFYDRLSHAISQARRRHDKLALFFLDLDGFKAVNDDYGHEAGDTVLKAVAMRLQACVRGADTIARLGGDEFTVILSEVEKPDDVNNIAEKILQKLSEPVLLHGVQKCAIGVSIGIALFPDDGYELDKLVSAADGAMYESKARGKNTYTYAGGESGSGAGGQPWIVLDAEHLLGVPEIDAQHQELMRLINKLNDAAKQARPTEVIAGLFDEIIAYTQFHFAAEEQLMEQNGYMGTEAHMREHRRLLGEVNYLRKKIIAGEELLALQYVKDWLLPHILGMDKPFARYLAQRGVN